MDGAGARDLDGALERLLRGGARFTGDIAAEGAAVAVFARSPHAHARIERVDPSAALETPGTVAVITAADLAGCGRFPAVAIHPALREGDFRAARRPILAEDAARFVGEPVAMVVAETESAARDALEALDIRYAPLAASLGPIERGGSATERPEPLIHAEIADNLAMDVTFGDADGVSRGFAAAARVVTATVALPRLSPSPMEPRGARAVYDPETGLRHLWTPNQGAPEIQRSLGAALAVPPETIRVHADAVGGAFGARGSSYPEHAALLVAAERLGRPIVWRASRGEDFEAEAHGRGNLLTGRLALDGEGRFLAIDIRYEADLGAYASPVGAHINVKNPAACLTGAYAIDRAAVRVVQRYTNAAPTGPYRGAGRPDIAALVERLVDQAAHETGADPLALRRMNAAPNGWVSPLGKTYDAVAFPDLLRAAAETADWSGAPARKRAAAADGRLRGVGAALFVEVAGGGAAPLDQAKLSLEASADGLIGRAIVLGRNSGQGHGAALPQIVADPLGLSPSAVSVIASDGGDGLAGSGAFASRGTIAMGSALRDAADKAGVALRALAAEHLAAEPGEILLAGGAARTPSGGEVDLATLVSLATQGAGPLDFIGETPLRESYPSGCHIAEIEIDPETGAARLISYAGVDDGGTALDHARVEGQILGGVMQGLGEALLEAVRYDPSDGQLLSGGFMDYAMPRADLAPNLRILSRDTPATTNPLGVKGVGEAGVAGALAAVSNAVVDALRGRVAPDALQAPFTPARIWSALAAADAGRL